MRRCMEQLTHICDQLSATKGHATNCPRDELSATNRPRRIVRRRIRLAPWKDYDIKEGGSWLFSVAVGHFNNDTHLDIVVAHSVGNKIAILLGHGNGTFTAPSTYSTGDASVPHYVIVADFNHDNRSDIVAANFGNNEIVIFFGHGNGSFQLQRRFPTGYGSKPIGIAAADLDNDQHLELVVTLWGTGRLAVLTEYMAAKFVNETTHSTGAALHSVSVAIDHLNNDNRSDLVIANSGTDNLHIFFASNSATFGTAMPYSLDENSHPQYVITCDVNEDHHPDIISVNSQTDSISVIIGHGNGAFAKQLVYPTGRSSHPSSIVADYVNNDHRLDLIVTNQGTEQIGIFFGFDYASFRDQFMNRTFDDRAPSSMNVNDFNNDHHLDIAVLFYLNASFGILFGHGNGSFGNMMHYPMEPDSYLFKIAAQDINNDTHIDIIIAIVNRAYDNSSICVFLGYGNGHFAPMVTYSTGKDQYLIGIVVGDCNNDHRLDIIVGNYGASKIGVFLGHGDGSFANVVITFIKDKFYPCSIAVSHFNNDGYLDVAVVSIDAKSIAVLFGYGNGTFGDLFIFNGNFSPLWISVGDFNRDNYVDIATANYHDNSVGILLGYGNGTFDKTIKTYSTGMGSTPTCINVNDFNGDSILDIAVTNAGIHEIVVLFGLGDGSFLLGKPYSTGLRSTPWELEIGDFNNDSRLDIVVSNSQSENIVIFLGYDIEPFATMFIPRNDFRLQMQSLASGDLDHDNRSDIVVANYDSDNVGILLEFDGQKFNTVRNYSTGIRSGPYSIALGHLNNDTHLDVAVANSESDNILLLFGHGNGIFGSEKIYSTGIHSRPYSIAINDLNNDHLMDIAIVNFDTSQILLLYGYGDGTFGHQRFYSLGYGYHPYSIATKDLNNDDLIDIVIACYDTDHVEVFMQMCLA